MVRLNNLTDADGAELMRAYNFSRAHDNLVDGPTARWADALAQSVAAWCAKRRKDLAFRGPEITKVLAQYMGLSHTVDVVERVTGQTFH